MSDIKYILSLTACAPRLMASSVFASSLCKVLLLCTPLSAARLLNSAGTLCSVLGISALSHGIPHPNVSAEFPTPTHLCSNSSVEC